LIDILKKSAVLTGISSLNVSKVRGEQFLTRKYRKKLKV